MRLKERLIAINTIADGLLVLDERDADQLLDRTGAPQTPSGWGRLPYDERRAEMMTRLGQQDDAVIERLYPAVSPEAAAMVDAVAEALYTNAQADVVFILQQADAKRIGAISFWHELPGDARKSFVKMLLRASGVDVVENLHEIVEPGEPSVEPAQVAAEPEPSPFPETSAVDEAGPIFIVHGHAHGLLYETQIVLERATGREVVVLHQKANSGKTLIEKFEDEAAKAAFAVVLLTADDEGGAKAEEGRRPRGRQNVIFELGFFYAKLGRSRVAVLVDQGVEEPSDLRGLVYIQIDQGGGWKQRLSKELVPAGIPWDWSKVP